MSVSGSQVIGTVSADIHFYYCPCTYELPLFLNLHFYQYRLVSTDLFSSWFSYNVSLLLLSHSFKSFRVESITSIYLTYFCTAYHNVGWKTMFFLPTLDFFPSLFYLSNYISNGCSSMKCWRGRYGRNPGTCWLVSKEVDSLPEGCQPWLSFCLRMHHAYPITCMHTHIQTQGSIKHAWDCFKSNGQEYRIICITTKTVLDTFILH